MDVYRLLWHFGGLKSCDVQKEVEDMDGMLTIKVGVGVGGG